MFKSLPEIGVIIEKKRKEIGITQRALSSKVNISTDYIYKIESGKVLDITISRLSRLLSELNIKIEEVLK